MSRLKDYIIIEASKSDIRQIQNLSDIAFRSTYKDILSAEQMEYMMYWMYSSESLQNQFEQGHRYFIAYLEDTPVGYASLQPEGADDGVQVFHLQKLYVLPSEQGCGLGRMLFERAAGLALESAKGQVARLELNVNRSNPAVDFYKHLGLKILRQGGFPIGCGFYMNDYIMGIDL